MEESKTAERSDGRVEITSETTLIPAQNYCVFTSKMGDYRSGLVGDSASFDEAYPTVAYGNLNDDCRTDLDCLDGTRCGTDAHTGARYCQLPARIDFKCGRTPEDTRCHHITMTGQKALCKDSACPPLDSGAGRRTGIRESGASSRRPRAPTRELCDAAQMYYHQPSGSGFCMAIEQITGKPMHMPEKCCSPAIGFNSDLDPEYLKYSLSPQYYGHPMYGNH